MGSEYLFYGRDEVLKDAITQLERQVDRLKTRVDQLEREVAPLTTRLTGRNRD